MLRNFPRPTTNRIDLKQFELNSDYILRSVSSSQQKEQEEKPTEEDEAPYDDSVLNDVTKYSKDLINDALLQDEMDESGKDEKDEEDETTKDVNNDAKSGNTKDEFILKMIFKIVPIGVNIAKKGKTIATGFKELSMGIVNLIKNIALLTAVIGLDTISFVIQLFVYIFKSLLCTVNIMINFPKCVVFYIINIIILIIICIIVSILFLFDVFLLVKYFMGTSCVEAFIMLLEGLEMIDRQLYFLFSFHIIHYPDSINNMCYRCSAMGDTSGFDLAFSRLFNDIFISLPTNIGGPVGEAITGIGHIFSFFNLG